jgi:hypothetical protein
MPSSSIAAHSNEVDTARISPLRQERLVEASRSSDADGAPESDDVVLPLVIRRPPDH